MATETSLATLWHTPEELWSLIAPLLGPEKPPGTPGRPAVPYRRIFDGILYVLRTGCQWSALPRAEYAPKSTVWGRFKQWVEMASPGRRDHQSTAGGRSHRPQPRRSGQSRHQTQRVERRARRPVGRG